MSLPEGLLSIAVELAELDSSRPGRPRPEGLRRAVSTAYYALYHLLISDAVRSMFQNDTDRRRFGPAAARGFTHSAVLSLARDALRAPGSRKADLLTMFGQQPLSADLSLVCDVFERMHSAREAADYDWSHRLRRSEVRVLLASVATAFAAWSRVRPTDEGKAFLVALILTRQRRAER